MKLEVGMYVRTKITDNCNCVYIRKITEIDDSGTLRNQICIDEDVIDGWGDDRILIDIEDIAKASHNLLGNDQEPCLIEVGDYVNGYKVIDFDFTYFNGIDRPKEPQKIEVIVDNGKFEFENHIKKDDIKSIVTKEQFESMAYKVDD